MLLNLALAVTCLPFSLADQHVESPQEQLSVTHNEPVKRIAVIGAGAGGSSAAYYLSQYAAEAGIPANITVFERSSYIGGRSTTVNAWDAPSVPVELGASIFVSVNHILVEAVQRFNLSTSALESFEDAQAGQDDKFGSADFIGVWDGQTFVFTGSDELSWWDTAKLLWKYGLAPIRTMRLMKATVGTFLEMYKEPHFPWPSLSEKAHELGLVGASAATGDEFLRKNNIGGKFAHDVIQASTRVNYAQNLQMINGLLSMVCMATNGAMAVAGGNWQIFASLLKASFNTEVRLNSSVTALGKESDGRYTVASSSFADGGAVQIPQQEYFDSVILAAPYQFANISISPEPQHVPDKIPYVQLHVTLFTSPHPLSGAAFNLEPGAKVPQVILTTLAPGESPEGQVNFVGQAGFWSISNLRSVRHPGSANVPAGRKEYLYKVFSPAPLENTFLAKILGIAEPLEDEEYEFGERDISWIYRKVWNSYPYELPRVTFDELRLDDGLWYTSSIEPFISTMETSALAGKNVARLVVDEWLEKEGAQTSRGSVQEGEQEL